MIKNQYAFGFNALMGKFRAMSIAEFFKNKKVEIIADIACGPGDLIYELDQISTMVKKVKKITAIDADKTYLKDFKNRFHGNKFYFVNIDIEKDELPDEKYDLIFLIDILEHLKNPEAFLKKAKKYLNKHGYVVIISPNATSLHRQIGKRMGLIKTLYELGIGDIHVGHKRYFDFRRMRMLVKNSGLKIILESGILLKPLNNKKMEEFSMEYCQALYEIGKNLPEYCGELFFICQK